MAIGDAHVFKNLCMFPSSFLGVNRLKTDAAYWYLPIFHGDSSVY